MTPTVNIFWFRRDLRLQDNAGLYHALKSSNPVVPVFIFDTNILDELEDTKDARVSFIYEAIIGIQKTLKKMNSTLHVLHDNPLESFREIVRAYKVENVFTNHDYEPYANDRDHEVKSFLNSYSIPFHTYKDQVIFEKDEVLKDNGEPYTIFTPYSRKWKEKMNQFYLSAYPNKKYFSNFFQQEAKQIPALKKMGFVKVSCHFPRENVDEKIVKNYDKTRDYPGLAHSTTRMGIHLRFGTVSIRQLAATAQQLNSIYLNELIWRDFYHMILWHFPKVGRGKAFKAEYDHISWLNNEQDFERWCNGMTGYPIVDAGMRELNATGYMHNRVRMITASFLSKHLLIDWRWGEAYFAAKLLDYDLASNNGGWQWAASSGCDAVPYFRIFNPDLQTKRFDEAHNYINKWIPELNKLTYPQPMIEHKFARDRALKAYKKALSKGNINAG